MTLLLDHIVHTYMDLIDVIKKGSVFKSHHATFFLNVNKI